jgi:hypothetical protein
MLASTRFLFGSKRMPATTFTKHVGHGRYQIKETGGLWILSVDRLLADGSMLSAPENCHLMATIDAIILAEYPAAPTSVGQQGSSVATLVSNFGILVQWMKLRGIHYFGHLTDVDLRNFIYDSSCGLDAVLQSQERLRAMLNEHKINGTAAPLDLATALVAAGIPHTQTPALPASRAVLTEFIKSGELPACRKLEPKQVGAKVLWKRAMTFQLLWRHRDRVADGLSFEPSQSDIAKHVKRWGKEAKGTRTLPIDYTCNLVGMSFTWLYEYGPVLADVERVLANLPSGKKERKTLLDKTLTDFNALAIGKNWPIRLQTHRDQPTPGYFSWFVATSVFLPLACFVICGIFTARRLAELVSFYAERLNGTRETGYWYSSYIAKRAMDGAFPCTASVADSIRALAYLMELRGVKQEQPVFSAMRGKARLGQRLRKALTRYGKLVESADGKEWQLAPHQFRKIYALIYRWRYDHPSLIALSLIFGHVNTKHIAVYTNSKEWKRDNMEAGKQFTLAKLRDIALGEVTPKGIFGKSLERAISRALGSVELSDESEQLTVLTNLIERRQLDLRATLWGYCGAKSVHSNIRRAACATEEIVQSKATVDPEKSSEDKCAGCLFFSTDSSRRVHWLGKSERLNISIASAPTSMAKRVMQERHQKIESFVRNNFQEHNE